MLIMENRTSFDTLKLHISKYYKFKHKQTLQISYKPFINLFILIVSNEVKKDKQAEQNKKKIVLYFTL